MKFSLIPCHLHSPRWLPAAAAALLIACATGCASPGPPRPPSLDLPETVKDLTAERVANEVRLRWTTPEMTTDRMAIKGPTTAEICRIAAQTSLVCTPVTRLPVQPGPSHTADTLPPALTVDPASLLAYRVQILNAHGHSAGPSPEAFAAAGAAPPPVEQLRAAPSPDGAMLEWQQNPSTAAVELDRLPVGPNGVVIEPAPPKTSSKSSSPSKPATRKQPAPPQKPTPATTPKPLQTAPATPI